MDKKTVLPLVFMFLLGIAGGFGISLFLPRENVFTDSGVLITSLSDGQEVHSKVIVDAVVWGAEAVEVLVNGEVVANYLPYVWNNILEPAGTYNITVNIYEKDDKLLSTDSKTIVIEEEFIVPENYNFTEDFVIHTGQTVYMNYNFSISDYAISNGWSSVDEKQYYAINNYGTLIINGDIICSTFLGEGDSITRLESGSIDVLEFNIIEDLYTMEGEYLRFDDNSQFLTAENYEVVFNQDNAIIFDNGDWAFFLENATFSEI